MLPDPFDTRPEEYDAWYDENPQLFREELKLIKDWIVGSPSVEIGVGTGRFASSLGIGFGLDRAKGALRLARKRAVKTVAGDAAALPFRGECFALAGIFFTLEFLAEPEKALDECRRVLAPNGRLVLLHFLPSSPVAEAKGRGFYTGMVQIYGPEDVRGMAWGFCLKDRRERDNLSALLFVKA